MKRGEVVGEQEVMGKSGCSLVLYSESMRERDRNREVGSARIVFEKREKEIKTR